MKKSTTILSFGVVSILLLGLGCIRDRENVPVGDTNNTISLSDSQTYVHDDPGFEFHYPAAWRADAQSTSEIDSVLKTVYFHEGSESQPVLQVWVTDTRNVPDELIGGDSPLTKSEVNFLKSEWKNKAEVNNHGESILIRPSYEVSSGEFFLEAIAFVGTDMIQLMMPLSITDPRGAWGPEKRGKVANIIEDLSEGNYPTDRVHAEFSLFTDITSSFLVK